MTIPQTIRKTFASPTPVTLQNWTGRDLFFSTHIHQVYKLMTAPKSVWDAAQLDGVIFDKCNLAGAEFYETRMSGGFTFCNLAGADFRFADLSTVKFHGCVLTGANFRQAQINFCDNELVGHILTEAADTDALKIECRMYAAVGHFDGLSADFQTHYYTIMQSYLHECVDTPTLRKFAAWGIGYADALIKAQDSIEIPF